jgi:hypothetical protein
MRRSCFRSSPESGLNSNAPNLTIRGPEEVPALAIPDRRARAAQILENIVAQAGDLIESRSPELVAQARQHCGSTATKHRYRPNSARLHSRPFSSIRGVRPKLTQRRIASLAPLVSLYGLKVLRKQNYNDYRCGD